MLFRKTKIKVELRDVISFKYPFASKESVLIVRKEKHCWFCSKKYKNSEFFGVTYTNKGAIICCDDCCKTFEQNEIKRVKEDK